MTNNIRQIQEIIQPQQVIEGAGVLLRRSFGPHVSNRFDPFLLFDHFAFNDPIEGPIMGFPTHPHRGIETVTYMLEGNVRHRDSLGNVGVIGPGGVQWMTSGRGILHEEMPKRSREGHVNGFQLWVNLPAALKMGPPRYQEVEARDIQTVRENGVDVRVVAGEFKGTAGVVTEIAAQPIYMDITLTAGSSFSLPIPLGHTALAYLFEGAGHFGDRNEEIEAVHMLVFGDGEQFAAGTEDGMRFLLMAGAPFKEPIAPYGPFVMNTAEEIQQAFADLRNGTFVKDSAI
jgi:redox-sensitive bicupin YhaK (pirin superfamily)